jgi:hypothetical protein
MQTLIKDIKAKISHSTSMKTINIHLCQQHAKLIQLKPISVERFYGTTTIMTDYEKYVNISTQYMKILNKLAY